MHITPSQSRGRFTADQAPERASSLVAFAQQLKRLSAEHGLAVVCVNQATDAISTADPHHHPGGGGGGGYGGARQIVPALGLLWSECVTARWFLRRAPGGGSERTLGVVLSPHVAAVRATIALDEAGFHDA
jgi:hypothetical protein